MSQIKKKKSFGTNRALLMTKLTNSMNNTFVRFFLHFVQTDEFYVWLFL